MCNVLPNRRMAFTVLLSVLAAGCGIKWATNKVLSNPDAIAKVGAVYDVLTPRDTTERIVFIEGDSVFIEHTDTLRIVNDSLTVEVDTIKIATIRNIRRVDTVVKTLPPDNRAIKRLNDSLALYRSLAANMQGNADSTRQQLKTAEKRLIWIAGIILVLGVVIGLLLRFKLFKA